MIKQLRLNTLENSRKSYNRVAVAYLNDEMPTEKARTLGYLLNGILQFWRVEADIRIEKKLDAVIAEIEGNR